MTHLCRSCEKYAKLWARPMMSSAERCQDANKAPSPDQVKKHQPSVEIRREAGQGCWRRRGGGHLEGEQQRCPFFSPQVRQDGSGYDGENQADQDPDLTTNRWGDVTDLHVMVKPQLVNRSLLSHKAEDLRAQVGDIYNPIIISYI